MLDTFIIERIREQRRQQETAQIPLRIEVPEPGPPERRREVERSERDSERGITTIDFSI